MESRIQVDGGSPESQNDPPLSYGGDYSYEDSKSPFSNQEQSDSLDSEFFPLSKKSVLEKPARDGDKKKRRYRGMIEGEAQQHQGHNRRKPERERRERRVRSPPPPSSSTRSDHTGRRINAPSGHRSPRGYEGRRHSPRYYDEREGYLDVDRTTKRHPRREHREVRKGERGGDSQGQRSDHREEHYSSRSRSPLVKHHQRREEWRKERAVMSAEEGGSRSRKRRREQESVDQKRARRGRERSTPEAGQIDSPQDQESEEETSSSDNSHGRVDIRQENFDMIIKNLEQCSRSSSESSDEGEDEEGGGGGVGGGGGGGGGGVGGDSSLSVSPGSDQRRKERQSLSPNERDDMHPLHIMRSKFDSNDEDDDDDDDNDFSGEGKNNHPLPLASVPLALLSLTTITNTTNTLFSGYEEDLSGDESMMAGDEVEDRNREEVAIKNQDFSSLLAMELDRGYDDDEDNAEGVSGLPCYLPALMGCRNVECFEWLNRIEEGTYGVVHRAKDRKTGDIVALKKLKMEKEKEGFPITSLREINMLLKAKHPNIVHVKEIVVGSNMDKIFIVMEYVEHDLKALMETMQKPFVQGEVKTLMIQLLRAVHHLHDNWILHRDLKASNLLLSHKGILKVGDFGLAREYGSPLKNYTPVVVTLWYRAPELLLGAKQYSTAVDMWSTGCIFAEFLQKEPLFRGRSEIDQINLIFKELGTPNKMIWPGYDKLPTTEKVTFTNYPYNNLKKRFPPSVLSEEGFELLNKMLTYNPEKRISAHEALEHKYLIPSESPMAVLPSMFPTWPAKSEMVRNKKREKSPKPPEGGVNQPGEDKAPGFSLKF